LKESFKLLVRLKGLHRQKTVILSERSESKDLRLLCVSSPPALPARSGMKPASTTAAR
jgi:hypothetical protein